MPAVAARLASYVPLERERELHQRGGWTNWHQCSFLCDESANGSKSAYSCRRKRSVGTKQTGKVGDEHSKRKFVENGVFSGGRLEGSMVENASGTNENSWCHSKPSDKELPHDLNVAKKESRPEQILLSGSSFSWDEGSKDYCKIQALVAHQASKMIYQSLPPGYSLLHSTEQNYCSENMFFFGPFAHIREKLDYTFHLNYTLSRQQFQDALISKRLSEPIVSGINSGTFSTAPEPWIVFTAGPMGAGKGYVLHKLGEQGLFPLENFVEVDPDEIRTHQSHGLSSQLVQW
eukprot:CAMPEP_0197465812 /NCGR_PEP_ID=MMETSP1175-20131217/64725_1 /TAXON_ID=1003142 /ORGANISM="Triceratium dubium, Strain CCMP147" /LENGTH=289 /DNA_ID=CAMNT_0043001835 /DNA_START=353 /DNA_END=1219 /DNA_ORIENTATION=+